MDKMFEFYWFDVYRFWVCEVEEVFDDVLKMVGFVL